jgi:hypothetical protein
MSKVNALRTYCGPIKCIVLLSYNLCLRHLCAAFRSGYCPKLFINFHLIQAFYMPKPSHSSTHRFGDVYKLRISSIFSFTHPAVSSYFFCRSKYVLNHFSEIQNKFDELQITRLNKRPLT